MSGQRPPKGKNGQRPPGGKRPDLQKVANTLGISVQTLRRALELHLPTLKKRPNNLASQSTG
jgi:hypothetical protein